MRFFKNVRRKVYRGSSVLRRGWFWVQFVKRNGYVPSLRNPKTYNEKINYRKRDYQNPLFSICSDKIRAKDYVSEKITPDIIIPNYYVGESINFNTMKRIIEIKGDCFLKANHNSGPVHRLTTECTDEEILFAVRDVQSQLAIDFGKLVDEPWYSEIKRGVLVEKCLPPEEGESDIRDYKFHVFKQRDGSTRTFCAIDLDRGTNRTRSVFDEDFAYMNLHMNAPSIKAQISKPANYKKMCRMAARLAEPFSYVRVDFYNINGDIYFGELTFAPGSGNIHFLS